MTGQRLFFILLCEVQSPEGKHGVDCASMSLKQWFSNGGAWTPEGA